MNKKHEENANSIMENIIKNVCGMEIQWDPPPYRSNMLLSTITCAVWTSYEGSTKEGDFEKREDEEN